ncbi:alanine racemase [Demequina globuliformis]|uniref:alanine racemase n=1 Tax=Demequina globuliformis TaxID=676202 RepID=UPI000B03A246|nr:alanine racemase [Demequina globuliformis]
MTLIDPHTVLGADKSLPPWAHGITAAQALARAPRLRDCWTPVLAIDSVALQHNIDFLAGWVADHGLELMPHGKTSMSPPLWHRQLAAGATGITVATPWQARVAVESGIRTVMLAHQVASKDAAAWVAASIAAGAEIISWVDDAQAIAIMATAGQACGVEVPVLVELGRPQGRTGARTLDAARALIALVRRSPGVRLAGIAGYEGAITHGRHPDALATVRDYVADLTRLAVEAREGQEPLIVTAGGSAYPDAVAEGLQHAVDVGLRGVVRCGAYVLHDEGHYLEVSPFDHTRVPGGLRPAARGFARVTSTPEPGLALLDAGKRDVPYDEGLPTVRRALKADGTVTSLDGRARVEALNDQHTFLRGEGLAVDVGDIIELGLSHPCTMTDKWRLVPIVDDLSLGLDATIVDLLPTRF